MSSTSSVANAYLWATCNVPRWFRLFSRNVKGAFSSRQRARP